ncbi:hypothetical protein ACFWAY_51330, partial [Rhodococcus sp. NPDC059968]|uniref:hypothetical protein n=1 Tax=Rhodococcus sp. NPDC059968 TaxID=3347017 RepID=UPI00366D90D4
TGTCPPLAAASLMRIKAAIQAQVAAVFGIFSLTRVALTRVALGAGHSRRRGTRNPDMEVVRIWSIGGLICGFGVLSSCKLVGNANKRVSYFMRKSGLRVDAVDLARGTDPHAAGRPGWAGPEVPG